MVKPCLKCLIYFSIETKNKEKSALIKISAVLSRVLLLVK